jgi:hypothetical protein
MFIVKEAERQAQLSRKANGQSCCCNSGRQWRPKPLPIYGSF